MINFVLMVVLFPLVVALFALSALLVFMAIAGMREIWKGMKKDADSYTIRWR